MYIPLIWLKSWFFIEAFRLQNLLFVASLMSVSQYFCCVTPSGIAYLVIISWHMLCGCSLKVVNFCGSILLLGQIIWRITWLILPMLHSSWESRAYFFIFHVGFFPCCCFPPIIANHALLDLLNCFCNCWMRFSFFICSCWYKYLVIDAWTNGVGAGACASFGSGVVPGARS